MRLGECRPQVDGMPKKFHGGVTVAAILRDISSGQMKIRILRIDLDGTRNGVLCIC